ncbi:Uncharacterised protein [Mycobacteroides abscessus subsp. abscessus]|nr:Uncharacterised protein [Mycobacteroides abscessus subsp. abscessus]
MDEKPLRWARLTASMVSVSEPIWFTLTSRALAAFSSMPRCSRVTLVTNRSSPTSWTRSPRAAAIFDQPSQSSSFSGSSMETIG